MSLNICRSNARVAADAEQGLQNAISTAEDVTDETKSQSCEGSQKQSYHSLSAIQSGSRNLKCGTGTRQ